MTPDKFRAKLAYARYIASQATPKADHCLGCVLQEVGLRGGATEEWNERYRGVSDYYMTGARHAHEICLISRRRLLAIIDASIEDFDSRHPK